MAVKLVSGREVRMEGSRIILVLAGWLDLEAFTSKTWKGYLKQRKSRGRRGTMDGNNGMRAGKGTTFVVVARHRATNGRGE